MHYDYAGVSEVGFVFDGRAALEAKNSAQPRLPKGIRQEERLTGRVSAPRHTAGI